MATRVFLQGSAEECQACDACSRRGSEVRGHSLCNGSQMGPCFTPINQHKNFKTHNALSSIYAAVKEPHSTREVKGQSPGCSGSYRLCGFGVNNHKSTEMKSVMNPKPFDSSDIKG